MPVVRYAVNAKSSISFDQLLPSTSPSLEAFHLLGEKLGWGHLTPYRVLFNARGANISVTSDAGFNIMHHVVNELMELDQVWMEKHIHHQQKHYELHTTVQRRM